jgi:hypothetical protein
MEETSRGVSSAECGGRARSPRVAGCAGEKFRQRNLVARNELVYRDVERIV